MVVQLRRTGSTGFAGVPGVAMSAEWISGSLLALAVVLCIAGSVLQSTGVLSRRSACRRRRRRARRGARGAGHRDHGGCPVRDGDSWRIGVDCAERTALVTDGPFAVVRNPIYAGMIPAFTGVALLAPNVVTIAGAIVLLVALELQTRLVEEPYLARVHGERYAVYAARAGRFLPGSVACVSTAAGSSRGWHGQAARGVPEAARENVRLRRRTSQSRPSRCPRGRRAARRSSPRRRG
jgi:hypothetical protein